MEKPVLIQIGDELPVWRKTFQPHDLVAYGAATWDWHRSHYDKDWAAQRGLEKPIIDGQMYGGVVAQAVMAWAGPRGFIEKLSLNYRSIAFAGDSLQLSGKVSAIENTAETFVFVLSHRLSKRDAVIAEAMTRVRVPSR
ncbi:MAG: MaoC/PaaZ C-terminal domain-containing protein [Pseudomonadota bacterium]